MTIRLVSTAWDRELEDALRLAPASIELVSPFVKQSTIHRILAAHPTSVRLITRFRLADFLAGVSDVSALRLLMTHGHQVRGLRDLHSKVYLIRPRVLVTSANLTEAALSRNHEFGFVSEDPSIVAQCADYFQTLWSATGPDLAHDTLVGWDEELREAQESIGPTLRTIGRLPDHGATLRRTGVPRPPLPPATVSDSTSPSLTGHILLSPLIAARKAYVKFFGRSSERAERDTWVIEEVRRSGAHLVCTFPRNRRPNFMLTGTTIFMGRLVHSPDDILVFGQAKAVRPNRRLDQATPEDIALRPWRAAFPLYTRVTDPKFLDARLDNGVSLNELERELRANTFESTHRNAGRGSGNTDPRRARTQKPGMSLTRDAFAWLSARLEERFALHGRIAAEDLDGIA